MRLTLESCGMELAALDADPSWQLPDVLRTLPERFREKRYSVRAFFDVVELCGECTLSEIGAVDGAVLTIVRSKLPLSLKASHCHGSVEVCLAASGECLLTLTGLGLTVWPSGARGVAELTPDDDHVLTARGFRAMVRGPENQSVVKIWSTASGECLRTLAGCGFRISPDGELVLTFSDDDSAKIWSIASGECLRTFTGHGDGFLNTMFSPDGERVLIPCAGGSAKIWSIASGECVELPDQGRHSEFSSDGERALTISSRWVKISCTTSGECLHTLTHDVPIGFSHGLGEPHVTGAAFSPYGKHVLTTAGRGSGLGGEATSAKLWSTESGECLSTLTGVGEIVNVKEFSPNGEHVLTAGINASGIDDVEHLFPQIWSIASGEHPHTLMFTGDSLVSATFSPDGERVLTISLDRGEGRIESMGPGGGYRGPGVKIWQIWSTASGECLQTLTGFPGSVEADFSLPSGAFASSCSACSRQRAIWL